MAFGHEGDQLHLPYYLESMLEVINVVLVVRTEGPLHAHLVELAEALEVLGDEVAFTIVDMLFGQIICLLVCAIQLINIETVSENKIEKSGVVLPLLLDAIESVELRMSKVYLFICFKNIFLIPIK